MPATSKAQFRFMEGIANGSIPERGSLTKEKAAEYVSGQSPKGLPEHVKRRALHRVVSKLHKAMIGRKWRS
jgi:hypothetical protein